MYKKYFAFAKYLYDNYEYWDNTKDGDEYKKDGAVYSEKEIFEIWKKQIKKK